ncbi:hypothetical protein [uncultured Alistipes sp.]|uniref:hypothetical protein n=1 Tax=uncultured Alistipes sp. TaxID=538949 RepID=UPI00260E14A7|nr:hypothetical protein [uncultured Alistipes sp.]
MDRNVRLQALLRLFMERTPTAESRVGELLALVRVYASMHGFTTICGDAGFGRPADYARRAGELFPLLLGRVAATTDFALRARLVSALFFLSGETSFSYDSDEAEACREAALALLDDYVREERADDLACAAVCRCIADLCYPEGCGCEEWLSRLSGRVARWASALDDQGRWADADLRLAFERVEVMNRYSYMFLDDGFDGAVRRAYDHCASQLATCCEVGPGQLALLRAAYDAARQGNACAAGRATADRIAADLARWADAPAPEADPAACDARLGALALVLDNLCEAITDEQQRGLMAGGGIG